MDYVCVSFLELHLNLKVGVGGGGEVEEIIKPQAHNKILFHIIPNIKWNSKDPCAQILYVITEYI